MKYIYILGLLGLSISLSNCDADSFSQVVEIKIPTHEPALSVRALFNQGDTVLTILLADSKGILDSDNFETQQQATIQLFENDQLMSDFSFDNNLSRFVMKTPLGFGQEEATYRLEIMSPDFTPVSAIQQLPKSVPIITGKYTPQGTFSSEGDRVDAIEIEFQDPVGEENYYAIRGVQQFIFFEEQDTIYYESDIYIESNDPLVSFGSGQLLLLSDAAFNGKTYKVLLYSYNGLQDQGLKMQLLSVSRDAYLYHRSLSNYYDAVDNPFAEPVNVHQNIENGYGIFGLAGVSEIDLN